MNSRGYFTVKCMTRGMLPAKLSSLYTSEQAAIEAICCFLRNTDRANRAVIKK